MLSMAFDIDPIVRIYFRDFFLFSAQKVPSSKSYVADVFDSGIERCRLFN